MNNHRYILEPYKGMKTRYQCPSCQHKEKSFTLYVDTDTREYINIKVGRCNRESNCGYHYTPKQYFQDHSNFSPINTYSKFEKPRPSKLLDKEQPISFISDDLLKASLGGYATNHFILFLIARFGIERATEVTKRYLIGSSKHWEGSTVFWQIDMQGKVRTGKIILYNPTTGKRVKEPRTCINWVHSVLKTPGFNLRQVLFGEHLLNNNSLPCALVESEKSAVIASLYLPQFIWLATGSLSNLSEDRCEVLKGRKVILFPDLKGFDKWKSKASEIKYFSDYSISNLLETKAYEAEKEAGLDIADFMMKYDLEKFSPEIKKTNQLQINSSNNPITIELPFEETLQGQKFMFDLKDKYFSNPLLYQLLNEKPFTDAWNIIYLKLRSHF